MKTTAIIEAQNLKKIYLMGETPINALDDVTFNIQRGEFVAIIGTSGSGKSTLMHLIGCLDTPTSGTLLIDNQSTMKMTSDELAHIRNQKIGFVFQRFYLLPDLTALDNVALPKLYAGVSEHEAREKAKKLLSTVELDERISHYPYQLSGGQQQRVAIARSLANDPEIILADEPTGNLDSATGETIMHLFRKLNRENGITIVLVTHEREVAQEASRTIELRDGKIVSDVTV